MSGGWRRNGSRWSRDTNGSGRSRHTQGTRYSSLRLEGLDDCQKSAHLGLQAGFIRPEFFDYGVFPAAQNSQNKPEPQGDHGYHRRHGDVVQLVWRKAGCHRSEPRQETAEAAADEVGAHFAYPARSSCRSRINQPCLLVPACCAISRLRKWLAAATTTNRARESRRARCRAAPRR